MLLDLRNRKRRSVVGGLDAREGEIAPLLVRAGEAPEENEGSRGQSDERAGRGGSVTIIAGGEPKGEGGDKREEGLVRGLLLEVNGNLIFVIRRLSL